MQILTLYVVMIYLTALHASVAAKTFIYTYPLPLEYTEGVAKMPLARAEHPWTKWYDTDQVTSNRLMHLRFQELLCQNVYVQQMEGQDEERN